MKITKELKHWQVSLATSIAIYLVIYYITIDPIWFRNIFNTAENRAMTLLMIASKFVVDWSITKEINKTIRKRVIEEVIKEENIKKKPLTSFSRDNISDKELREAYEEVYKEAREKIT